jgi:hypothetical protein
VGPAGVAARALAGIDAAGAAAGVAAGALAVADCSARATGVVAGAAGADGAGALGALWATACEVTSARALAPNMHPSAKRQRTKVLVLTRANPMARDKLFPRGTSAGPGLACPTPRPSEHPT